MCVYPHRWSAHTDGGAFCESKCVCVHVCVFTELCEHVGEATCAQSMCVHLSVYLQMMAQMHVSF